MCIDANVFSFEIEFLVHWYSDIFSVITVTLKVLDHALVFNENGCEMSEYLAADLSAGFGSQVVVLQIPGSLLIHQTSTVKKAELEEKRENMQQKRQISNTI